MKDSKHSKKIANIVKKKDNKQEGTAWKSMWKRKAVEYGNSVNDTDWLDHWTCKKIFGKDIGTEFVN